MIGFCGAFDPQKRPVRFSLLKRMCGLHSAGCAFLNDGFGILCDSLPQDDATLQPITVSYNNSLYTAAIISAERANTARSILEGYFEEGEDFLRRLDFPYALALYDGRCGELLLAKGHLGDKALFYTFKDGALYFATSARALFRLYGGCVKVNQNALVRYLTGGYSSIPTDIFCDISVLKPDNSLLCNCFGHSCIPTVHTPYIDSTKSNISPIYPEKASQSDLRYVLHQALFAFDYPQFDCFMPSLMPQLERAGKGGQRHVSLCRVPDADEDYCAERAERLGQTWGLEVSVLPTVTDSCTGRELKKLEKELDGILDEYLSAPTCILHTLSREGVISSASDEKNVPLRIRKKGLLCQTAMWFDSFNMVLCI